MFSRCGSLKSTLLTALLLAMLAFPSVSPAQSLGVDQLNTLRWGADDAAKWKAYPAHLSPAKMDLATSAAHLAEHLRIVPQDDHPWLLCQCRCIAG